MSNSDNEENDMSLGDMFVVCSFRTLYDDDRADPPQRNPLERLLPSPRLLITRENVWIRAIGERLKSD